MCGRFSLDRNASIVEARFKAKLRVANTLPLFNIAPSGKAALIVPDAPDTIVTGHWGLGDATRMLINARGETVPTKWPFRSLFENRRCLILASGYIEWKAVGSKKIPHLHRLEGDPLFAMAGLYEDSENVRTGEIVRHFTMLTRPSGPITSALHDRMPLVIPEAFEMEWITSGKSPVQVLEKLMKQPEPPFRFYPISPLINKSYDNNPALLEFTPYEEPRQLSLFS